MSSNFIIIPEHIKQKQIPKHNLNPLYELSQQFEINYFNDITKDLLTSLYKTDKTLFFKVINQLVFFGVRFKNKFEKYNLINQNDKKVLKKNKNGFLNYDNLDKNISKFMRKYGLIKNQDINGLFFKSIIKKSKSDFNLNEFVESNKLKIINLEQYTYDDLIEEFSDHTSDKNHLNKKNYDNKIEEALYLIKNYDKNKISEKELKILIFKFVKYFGEISVYQLTEFIILYFDLLMIDNSGINFNRIKKLINNTNKLSWKNNYISIIKYLKECKTTNKDVNIINLFDSQENITFFYYMNRICEYKEFNKEYNSIEINYNYIIKLYEKINQKNYEDLIYNFIENSKEPVSLDKIKYNLSLVKNIKKEDIKNLLIKSEKFALIDLNKWGLVEWDEFFIEGCR